jgi:NADH dehydrogenase (ubiquinone) 1 alpha subcomplex subunit 10
MAGLASKLVSLGLVPAGAKATSCPAKLLAVQGLNNKVCTANIYSRTSGQLEERPKPWDYKRWGYNHFLQIAEGTTKRFNDNTKVIVVEGPPGLEKGKFAKELAEEFDMLYVPGVSMDDWYINSYGYDLRDLDWQFHHTKNKCYDEKSFAQDPLGNDGGLDRMLIKLQMMRAFQYNDLLAHLFNTGQGIVTEKSPFSEQLFMESCYKMGWVDKTTRVLYYKCRQQINQYLLRPNLIVYLDAPVDVVQAKIRERSKTTHPWEKDSPVFENTAYLKMLYEDTMKNDYLKKASLYSKVLNYDWSEGGETEVVVEDIERLQLEYFDKYDKQQSDWRMFKEDNYSQRRSLYTQKDWIRSSVYRVQYLDADLVETDGAENLEFQKVAHKLPGNYWAMGYNEEVGEKAPWIKIGKEQNATPMYTLVNHFIQTQEMDHYFQERKRRRLAGEQNWWNF